MSAIESPQQEIPQVYQRKLICNFVFDPMVAFVSLMSLIFNLIKIYLGEQMLGKAAIDSKEKQEPHQQNKGR
jgi:hypothetical protein